MKNFNQSFKLNMPKHCEQRRAYWSIESSLDRRLGVDEGHGIA